jgi:hypothetical protein
MKGTSIKLNARFCKRPGISVIKGIRILESSVKIVQIKSQIKNANLCFFGCVLFSIYELICEK